MKVFGVINLMSAKFIWCLLIELRYSINGTNGIQESLEVVGGTAYGSSENHRVVDTFHPSIKFLDRDKASGYICGHGGTIENYSNVNEISINGLQIN